MSIPFTAEDITNMRDAQSVHAYTDIAAYIPTPDLSNLDEYGQPTASSDVITVSCAFVDTARRENWREADVEELDAEIYLTGVTPAKGGHFRILKRFGQDVTNKTYEITGVQDRGAFGWVCALKVATV